MSRNKEHTDLLKLLIGKGMSELHAEMDKPSQDLGYKHRVVRHGIFEVILNTLTHGKAGLTGTVLHIIQDKLSTMSKETIREILDAHDKEEQYKLILKQMTDMEKRLLKRALEQKFEEDR